MNKKEVIEIISNRTLFPKSKVRRVFEELKTLIVEVVNKGGEVCINGMAKFAGKETKSRIFCSPITKRRFYSQPKKQIKVVLSKNFRFSIK